MRASRRARLSGIVLASMALAAAAALSAVALRGPAQPATMSDRVHAVASTLRCPVCQNLSVADSPSGLAEEMRAVIRQRLEEGRTSEEIRAEFVRSYGEWVLLSPPRQGINLLAWIAPALILTGGAVVVTVAARRWTRSGRESADTPDSTNDSAALTPEERLLLERALSSDPEASG